MDALTTFAPLVSTAAPAPKTQKSAEAAGEAFESYMVGFMAQQMRASVPDGPLSQGPAAMFADLFDQEIGRRVASGPGLGLKAEIVRALSHGAAPEQAVAPPPPAPAPASSPTVTSGFGMRADPIDGTLRHHDGVDLRAAAGTPVRAARDGVVRYAGPRGGYGNVVIIDHGGGFETRYAHCASLSVKPGQTVQAGEPIGTVGSTGHSTGPHLHFEVREDGEAIDPRGWLPEVEPVGAPVRPEPGS